MQYRFPVFNILYHKSLSNANVCLTSLSHFTYNEYVCNDVSPGRMRKPLLTQAVQSVLSLLLMMAVGFFLNDRPWFSKSGPAILSKFALNVAIPCNMAYNVYASVGSGERLIELVHTLPWPILGILAAMAVGGMLAALFRVRPDQSGVFVNVAGLSNTVFIGFPVINALFGGGAAMLGIVYYMANTCCFWTVGVFLLRRSGGEKAPFFSPGNLRKLLSPPILGLFAGAALLLLKIELPPFLDSAISAFSNTATPLALVFIGCVIRSANLKALAFSKHMVVLLLARFLAAPLIMYAVCRFCPVPPAFQPVFLILSCMPAMTQLGIMSREADCDYAFASVMVAVTTILSMALLPLYAAALPHLFTL